jgi:hypothetical protein
MAATVVGGRDGRARPDEDDVPDPGGEHVGLERRCGRREVAAHPEIAVVKVSPQLEALPVGKPRRQLPGGEDQLVQSHSPQRPLWKSGMVSNVAMRHGRKKPRPVPVVTG